MRTICLYGIEILLAIKDMHSKSIIHRDIKPTNVCLVDKQGRESRAGGHIKDIQLIDFGVSKYYNT